MNEDQYQGWHNWETWNVALWINNNYRAYQEMCSLRPFTAQKARLWVKRLYPNGTLDMKGGNGRFPYHKFVDWQEIADDFNEE